MGLWSRFGRRKGEEKDAPIDTEEKARVAGLALLLESEDVVARGKAVRALGEIGEAAVLPLMKGLGDEDWCVRREAATALGRVGPAAIPHLIGTFPHADSTMRQGAVQALRLLGNPAVEALKEAAHHEDAAVRCGALEAFEVFPAGDAFIEALDDDDPRVRRCAIAGIRRTCDGRGIARVAALLRDPDEQVRVLAAGTLAAFGEAAVSPCIEALGDDDEGFQWRNATVLTRIGAPAIASLSTALRDERPTVRRWAARVLGEIQSEEAIAPLIEALADPDREVRWHIGGALANIGTSSVGPLVAALGGGDETARHRVMEALWRVGETAVPALINLTGADDAQARCRSALILGEIAVPGASEALQPLLQDSDRDVRREAFEALEAIRARGDLTR